MELATAHVLTALYALAHRIALTPEELALLDERGRALTPEHWRETKDTLRLADRGGAGRGPNSTSDSFRLYSSGSAWRTRAHSPIATRSTLTRRSPAIGGVSPHSPLRSRVVRTSPMSTSSWR